MSDGKNFGIRLNEARIRKNMTLESLSKAVDLTTRTLSMYEQGERYPTVDNAQKIAAALDVSVASLIGEEGEIIERARNEYGSKGVRDINLLLAEVKGLFAGGELPEEDKDTLMKAFTEAYFIAKEKNRKYTPKRYRKSADTNSDDDDDNNVE